MAKPLNKDDAETPQLSATKFLNLYREMRAALLPMQSAVADYRLVRKRMKAEGVNMTALGILDTLSKLDEPAAVLVLRDLGMMARATDAPYVSQGDLFAAASDAPPAEDAAKADYAEGEALLNGDKAGFAGDKPDTNPWPPGHRNHAAWAKGWRRGQDRAVMTNLSPNKKAAAKAKTGDGDVTPAPTRVSRKRRDADQPGA